MGVSRHHFLAASDSSNSWAQMAVIFGYKARTVAALASKRSSLFRQIYHILHEFGVVPDQTMRVVHRVHACLSSRSDWTTLLPVRLIGGVPGSESVMYFGSRVKDVRSVFRPCRTATGLSGIITYFPLFHQRWTRPAVWKTSLQFLHVDRRTVDSAYPAVIVRRSLMLYRSGVCSRSNRNSESPLQGLCSGSNKSIEPRILME